MRRIKASIHRVCQMVMALTNLMIRAPACHWPLPEPLVPLVLERSPPVLWLATSLPLPALMAMVNHHLARLVTPRCHRSLQDTRTPLLVDTPKWHLTPTLSVVPISPVTRRPASSLKCRPHLHELSKPARHQNPQSRSRQFLKCLRTRLLPLNWTADMDKSARALLKDISTPL